MSVIVSQMILYTEDITEKWSLQQQKMITIAEMVWKWIVVIKVTFYPLMKQLQEAISKCLMKHDKQFDCCMPVHLSWQMAHPII